MQNSSAALLAAIVTAVVMFLFTSAWFTLIAARNTLRTAKASVPAARKLYRGKLGGVFKMGLLVAILAFCLIAWAAREVAGADEQKPAPTPSATHR